MNFFVKKDFIYFVFQYAEVLIIDVTWYKVTDYFSENFAHKSIVSTTMQLCSLLMFLLALLLRVKYSQKITSPNYSQNLIHRTDLICGPE
jgi:hypothetical protein